MLTAKPILLAIIAACGIQSNPVVSPDTPLGGDPVENAKAAAAQRTWLERQMQAVSSPSTSPDEPDRKPPEDVGLEDQHFCCQEIDLKSFTGDGCVLIDKTAAILCDKLLYCPGKYAKDDGKVACE
jgi:hypothetical protein